MLVLVYYTTNVNCFRTHPRYSVLFKLYKWFCWIFQGEAVVKNSRIFQNAMGMS